ncbi:hypothetical protein [Streptomyces sp. NPDC058683]|uniref:hypothetical protein n=1 Tax=Streptomyces sp. NPDC058683 TaxID=3346597 RepID=UPI00364C848D
MGDDRPRDHRLERTVRRGGPGPLIPEHRTARGSSLGKGGVAGGLWNCCLAVLVAALLVVCGCWVWVGAIAPAHYRQQARDAMRTSAAETAIRLRKSAADGTLLGTEIDRDVISGGPTTSGAKGVYRQGRTVTVIAEFTGIAPAAIMGTTEVTGCYEFDVRPPAVSMRGVSDQSCRDLAAQVYRPPAEVAADVVAELRAAFGRGGPAAASDAEVWSTRGIRLTARKTAGGLLTARALLLRAGAAGPDCYEFRARAGSVTARKLSRQACYDSV